MAAAGAYYVVCEGVTVHLFEGRGLFGDHVTKSTDDLFRNDVSDQNVNIRSKNFKDRLLCSQRQENSTASLSMVMNKFWKSFVFISISA